MAAHNPNTKRLAILERRKKVAARYLRGQTQWEIARAFEVNQSTISDDLRAIQKEWLAQAVLDRGDWTARELARIDEVERNAWAAWAKSQENAETLRARMRGQGNAETEKISKGQAGDPRFLEIVLKCIQKRCDLLRLDWGAGGDDDGADEDETGGYAALIAQARAAVERFRRRSDGETGGPAGQTPPVEPSAGPADDGPGVEV